MSRQEDNQNFICRGIRIVGTLELPYRYIDSLLQANVAQLVEQLTRNEQVAGSSPAVGSQGPVEYPTGLFYARGHPPTKHAHPLPPVY